MQPGYQPHAENAMVFGCTVKPWDCDYSPDSGWKFQISALRAAVTDNSKILVMSIPHNPTGKINHTVMSTDSCLQRMV